MSYQRTLAKPAAGRLATRMVFAVCLFALCTNVWAYRSALKSAQDFLDIGAYAQAITQFETALADSALKGRSRSKAEKGLERARGARAAELYAQGRRLEQQGEVQGALNAYRRATDYAPDNARYRTSFETLDRQFSGARQEAALILQNARGDNAWESALQALQRLDAAGEVPEVRLALNTLKLEAGDYYSRQSDLALLQGAYESALDNIVKAARFSQTREIQNRKLARHHLLQSQRAWESGRFATAYEELEQSLDFEPDNAQIVAYSSDLKGQFLGVLYNDALQAEAAGDLQRAGDKLAQISRYEPGYLDVADRLQALNGTLASGYYDKAIGLLRDGGSSAGLALAYFMVAAQQQSSLYPDVYDRIADAKSQLRASMEHRVSLTVTNSSPEPGAAGVVRDSILNSLKNSGLRHLQIMERQEPLEDILREQAMGQAFFDEATAVAVKQVKAVQSGIYVDVVRLSVSENGRDRPFYGSARYVSGSRYVPNARYSQLQQQIAISQQDLLQAQQAANKAQAEQNRMLSQAQANSGDRMAAIAGLGSVLGSAGATAQLRSAQERLDQLQYAMADESPQVEEDVYADFRYQIFDLELAGEVLLSYKIVDFATSEISESQTATARDVVTDRWIPGDPGKGVQPDPEELPSQELFKRGLLDAAIESLISGLERQLGAGTESYFRSAQIAAADGQRERAIENYIRYLYGGADLRSDEARAANDYVYEELGVQLLKRKP